MRLDLDRLQHFGERDIVAGPAVRLGVADLRLGAGLDHQTAIVRSELEVVAEADAEVIDPADLLDPSLTEQREPVDALDALADVNRVATGVFDLKPRESLGDLPHRGLKRLARV